MGRSRTIISAESMGLMGEMGRTWGKWLWLENWREITNMRTKYKVKVQQYLYRPGQGLRVVGG
jgi:hypothetical protein